VALAYSVLFFGKTSRPQVAAAAGVSSLICYLVRFSMYFNRSASIFALTLPLQGGDHKGANAGRVSKW